MRPATHTNQPPFLRTVRRSEDKPVETSCGPRRANTHPARPLGVKAFDYLWVKNDVRGASDLADLLRMGYLPEAWIARLRAPGAAEEPVGSRAHSG